MKKRSLQWFQEKAVRKTGELWEFAINELKEGKKKPRNNRSANNFRNVKYFNV